jgi:hypothetical protein
MNVQEIPKTPKITRRDFVELCVRHTIHPAIALENDNIVAALKNESGNARTEVYAKVENILQTEF